MAEVSRFFGVVVRMFAREHLPPHFHVSYGGLEGRFRIDDLEPMDRGLAPRVIRLVREWGRAHGPELERSWQRIHLRLQLTDGSVVERDLSRFLEGPYFEPVRRNRAVFRKVRAAYGTVAWPGKIDMCPDVLIWSGPPPEDATIRPSPFLEVVIGRPPRRRRGPRAARKGTGAGGPGSRN